MIAMMKKGVGEIVAPIKTGFSLRNLLHFAKEKIKSIFQEVWETQKEFDEERKRVDEMEERINQIVQMKREIDRSIQIVTKKKAVKPKKEELTSRKIVYKEKTDISQNLRRESEVGNAIAVVEGLLNKSKNGELSIQKVEGRQSLLPKDYGSKMQKTSSLDPVVEENTVVKPKENDFYEHLENKKETKCSNKEVSKKPLTVFECIQKIKIIDRYLQKNENSGDFKILYYAKKMIDLRQDYISKMKQAVLLSMCQFNGELRQYMNIIVGEEMNYEEEDIEMMNKNYLFLRNLYIQYLAEEEVRIVLASIETKVNFINKKAMETKGKISFIKEKVA